MSLSQSPFGIVPVEVAMDQRLTLQQMRVLVALYTFRNKNTELAHPTREEIRERTGMALPKISTATTDLERLGWLTKAGNGGRSQATRYRVHVPVTVTEQVTVTKSVTVTDPVINPSRIGNETLPESGRGKEQTIQTRTNKKTARDGATAIPDIPDNLMADFLVVRKAKRAGPLTDTALGGMRREAGKAGLTLEQAITFCCEAGWQAFNAGWYAARMGGKQSARSAAAEEPAWRTEQRTRMAEFAPMAAAKPRTENVIDMETTHALAR